MGNREREYVFEVPARARLRLGPVLLDLAASVCRHPPVRIRDLYLDTPGHDLLKAGFACRLREKRGRAELTVKSLVPFVDGLADREERTRDWGPLPAVPPATLPASLRLKRIRVRPDAPLLPLFELVQVRQVYDVKTNDGAVCEVSLDRTRMSGAARGQGLRRLEVERRTGSTAELKAFAAALASRLGLRPAAFSKFHYGYNAAGVAAGR